MLLDEPAVGVLASDSNLWRTRHLKIRAGALREKIAPFEWEALHIEGRVNTADVGTKVLTSSAIQRRPGPGPFAQAGVGPHEASPPLGDTVPQELCKLQPVPGHC